MSIRYLSDPEIALAKPVFKDSLPWYKIQISSQIGAQDRPYTWGRVLKVGPYLYPGLDTSDPSTLIHELTHVWQHEHRSFSGSYILDSAAAQLMHGSKAYDYTPGQAWDTYNAEQQAHIVEDWFTGGQKTDPKDQRYPYIRDTIRQKRIDPNDNPWEATDAATFQSKREF